jgi:hypothetical protein
VPLIPAFMRSQTLERLAGVRTGLSILQRRDSLEYAMGNPRICSALIIGSLACSCRLRTPCAKFWTVAGRTASDASFGITSEYQAQSYFSVISRRIHSTACSNLFSITDRA